MAASIPAVHNLTATSGLHIRTGFRAPGKRRFAAAISG